MKKNMFFLLISLAVAACICIIVYVNQKVNSIVVIDVIKVVNEFKLKKDLEQTAEGKLNIVVQKIDSLKSLLERAQQEKDEERFNIVAEELDILQRQGEMAYEKTNQNINEQVWKRLNPLIDAFGKKNGYRVIIGANGMGTVLYQDEAIDRTTDLIKYVNENYEKGSK